MAKVVNSSKMMMALQKQPKATSTSFEVDNSAVRAKELALANESDESILDRLRARFEILDDMTRAVKKGDVRAMIVTGPPGVGKSFGVEKVLARHDVFADVAQDGKLKKYEVVKGAMSAIGIYSKLY